MSNLFFSSPMSDDEVALANCDEHAAEFVRTWTLVV